MGSSLDGAIGLMDEGAKKIGVVSALPIGCLPAIITANSKDPIHSRKCIERFNSISRDYNKLLENNLKGVQRWDTRIIYADIYKPIMDMVTRNRQNVGNTQTTSHPDLQSRSKTTSPEDQIRPTLTKIFPNLLTKCKDLLLFASWLLISVHFNHHLLRSVWLSPRSDQICLPNA
ncbi:unnamed protein product [Lactuca saligna]|uniref:GDSL esterase/lipase n=1 Tax=Lactuca saligna TaxID=75948 RepID=A0AA35VJN7_LACSI|nr:unnamed protein product [Lactuca saligna]